MLSLDHALLMKILNFAKKKVVLSKMCSGKFIKLQFKDL